MTLDDKGRMSLPSKIREKIEGNTVVMTKGTEKCLWLYLPEEWEIVANQLNEKKKASPFSRGPQNVARHFIGSHEKVEIDKTGRIKLTSPLMKYAGLSRSCYFIGVGERMELWDESIFEEFENHNSPEIWQTLEELGKSETVE